MLKLLLAILFGLLIVSTVLVVFFDNGDSGRKIAWLLVLAVLPVIGLILYLLFGLNLRHHWIYNSRHRKYREYFSANMDEDINSKIFGREAEETVQERYRPLARMLSCDERPTVSGDNSLEIITSGARKAELLMEDISNAREYIHIEYFHFWDDSSGTAVRDLLIQKAREGVKVRFLIENIADFHVVPRYYDSLREAGAEVVKFTNPRKHVLTLITRLNYRNHRKVVVIDGKVGYIGGMNINNNYFLQWRDTHLRVSGGVIAGLQQTFLDSWLISGGTLDRPLGDYFRCGKDNLATDFPVSPNVFHGKLMQVVPDSPEASFKAIQMGYESILHSAREYVWFQTPYFVPPEPVMEALKSAALGGVDVRIMIPEKADQFFMELARLSFYEDCLEAGIKLFLRRGEFDHSKTIICDDYIVCIGSANMDNRSFSINYEANAYIYDEETAVRCKEIFTEELKNCYEVTEQDIEGIPWYKRIGQRITDLFAPIL